MVIRGIILFKNTSAFHEKEEEEKEAAKAEEEKEAEKSAEEKTEE